MQASKKPTDDIPLLISRSSMTTEVNKTGSWRFMRPLAEEKTAPCSAACPVGEDIGRIEMLAFRGLFREAYETILKENPFPAVCGRVCFHPCENVCNREAFDRAVAIRHLERFFGDFALSEEIALPVNKHPDNEKQVAIIGAGPAGLAAAYFLSGLGFGCNVFESEPEPGGMLRWGIPPYRLPEDMLQREIQRIQNQGVNIHCKHPVDKNRYETIKTSHDAIFIGCGYGKSITMGIYGEKMALEGLDLLRSIRKGKLQSFQGKVAVIGGGNTAVDVARSLIRLGASPVLVYRRRRQDMPAFGQEVEMSLKEGIALKELLTPVRIEKQGREKVLTLQKMTIIGIGVNSRARVVPDSGNTETLCVDTVVKAIGAGPDPQWYFPSGKTDNGLTLSHCRLLDEGVPIVFGGDLTNHTKSVTDAIASGKQAAMAIDTVFQSGWDAVEKKLGTCRVGNGPALSMEIYKGGDRQNRNSRLISFKEINTDYFQPSSRVAPSSKPRSDVKKTFAEIELTLSPDSAETEASRCFNCGICNECDNCRLFCPELAVLLNEKGRHINLDYCKGCGLCVEECPRSVMALEEEKR